MSSGCSLRNLFARPVLPALLAVLSLCLAPTPASAQQFGQWWWEAGLLAGQRTTDNLRGGSKVSEFEQTEARLSMALNGFLGHPALGTFRLGVDLLATQVDGGNSVDTDRAGFSADLGILPEGAYPSRLFARVLQYDYAGGAAADPLTALRAPDSTTEWGGRFRVRRGPLRGMQLGFDHATTEFMDADSRDTVYDRQYLDWSRGGPKAQHHIKLDHRLRDYGVVDLEFEDLILNLEERNDLSPTWRWDMSASGFRRDSKSPGMNAASTDSFRMFNRFLHTIRNRDRLDIQTNADWIRPELQSGVDSYGLSLFYRWRPMDGLEVAPFGQYAEQSSDSQEVRSPRVGTGVSWSRRAGALDTLVGGRVSYGIVDQTIPTESSDESRTAFAVNGSLGHGIGKGLRKEIELELARNELRFDRNPLLDLPDLGLPLSTLGTEDFHRARAGLSRRWDSRSLGGWAEWNHRESSDGTPGFDFDSETTTITIQHGAPRYEIRASAGETSLDRGVGDDQEVSYEGASATWRPWRFLRVWGSYRSDKRELTVTPDIDGERIQAGLTLRVGQLVVEASAYRTEEQSAARPESRNEGFSWSVGRRFAGWLPVVTGSRRRGVIR